MKEIKTSGSTYLLVEVKRYARNAGIIPILHKDSTCMLSYDDEIGHDGSCEKILPPGQWSIIGKADELTEDQWKGIVESDVLVHEDGHHFDEYFRDYQDVQQIIGSEYNFDTALQSGKSLLTHHGYEFSKTLILKQQ